MRKGGAYALVLFFAAVLTLFVPAIVAKAEAKSRAEVNIFLPGSADNIGLLTNFETTLGIKFTAAMWYQNWSSGLDPTEAKNFHNSGHIPELTWEPQTDDGTGISYDAVISGSYDSYLTSMANQVGNLGFPIRISLAPEMNTDWTPWGIGLQGNNASNFKGFWQHVVQKFRDAGTTNVAWIWSPNVTPDNAGALYGGNLVNLYPGDGFVDYMGLDGYNWGSSQSWSVWQSFAQVFQSSYQQLTSFSGKEILIMEIASTESGGNKAAWITDLFSQLQNNYPHIKGFTWFDINKETDWRINSSAAAQAAFVSGANGTTTGPTVGGSTSSSPPAQSKTSSKTATTEQPVTTSTPADPPVATPAAATTPADSTAVRYPPTQPLLPKIAGTLVASATFTQPELTSLLVLLFGGIALVSYITLRRHQSFDRSPPIAITNRFGLGLVDGIFVPARYERMSDKPDPPSSNSCNKKVARF